MIEINQLQYRYKGAPAPSLRDISLKIPQQSLFGLLGPNGAGKTTLLSILSGIFSCPADKVIIDQQDITKHQRLWKKKISLIPQEYAFYDRLSVIENLKFFSGLHHFTSRERADRIEEAIRVTQLENYSSSRAETLSGGLKRRLNLAIGLLNKPQLLLLDEPTAGIDPHSRHFILETIRHLNTEGTTVLYSSHYMEEVESLCEDIAIIDQGKILIQGSLSELLLTHNKSTLRLVLQSPITSEQDRLLQTALKWVYKLSDDRHQLELQVVDGGTLIPVLQALSLASIPVAQIQYGSQSLEDLFLDLTQRKLRDQ